MLNHKRKIVTATILWNVNYILGSAGKITTQLYLYLRHSYLETVIWETAQLAAVLCPKYQSAFLI